MSVTVYSVVSDRCGNCVECSQLRTPPLCSMQVLRMALHPDIPGHPTRSCEAQVPFKVAYRFLDEVEWRYSCLGTDAQMREGCRFEARLPYLDDDVDVYEEAALAWLLEGK